MGALGDYAIIRDLGQDGLTRRLLARAPDGSTVLLRVVEPVAAVTGEAAAARAVRAFEASVDLQSSVAGLSSCVCPVVDRGRTEGGGAFAASGAAGTTWGDLAAGRVRLDGATIRHLACALIESCAAFRGASGRGHGRIGASTVVVESPEAIGASAVRLDDPDAERDSSEAEDARSVGGLIFALVEHRAFEARLWPPQSGGEWSVFGSAAPGWLSLVTDLCHPNAGERPSLETALERARGLRGARRKNRAGAVALIAGLTLAGVGAGVWWTVGRSAVVVVDEFGMPAEAGERWRRLCLGWDGWFGAMVTEGPRLESVADEHLRARVLGPIASARAAGVVLDPGAIVGVRGSARLLAERPPEAAGDADAIARTRQAVEVLAAIEGATSPEAWALAAEAGRAGEALEAMGWTGAGRALRSRVERAGASADADRVEAVREIASEAPLIRATLGAPARLTSVSSAARATGDPVLGELADAMGAIGSASSSLDEAFRVTGAWVSLAERVELAIQTRWAEVDSDAMRAHASLYSDGTRAGLSAMEIGERWLVTLQEDRFTRLEQAHPAIAIEASLDAARASAGELNAPTLAASIAQTQERARALRARPWNRITRAEVDSAASTLRAETVQLSAAVEDARWAGGVDFAAYSVEVAGRPAPVTIASDALESLWGRGRDRLVELAEVEGDALRLRDGVRALAAVIAALEARFPLLSGDGLAAGADAGAFAREAAALRELGLGEAIEAAGLAEIGSSLDVREVDRLARAPGEVYAARLRDAEGVFAEVRELERVLNTLAGVPGDGAIEAVSARAASAGVAGTVEPVLVRARGVRAAGAETSVEALITIVSSEARAAAFAGYLRLGELGWPRDEASIRQDAGLRPRVRALAESVADERARGEALRLLDGAGAERWRRFGELAGDADRVRTAISVREAMGGRVETLSARARGNLASVALLDAARGAENDEGVRTALRAFIADLEASRSEGVFAERLRAARALLVVEEAGPGANPARMGPGAPAVRWTGEAAAGNETVRFDVPGADGVSVTFAPVRVGERVVYMTTEEVSLGLLSAGVTWSEGWESLAVRQVWPALVGARTASTDQVRDSARGWVWRDGRLQPRSLWVSPLPITGATSLIAPSLAGREGGGGGNPSLDHPVQAVPPSAAEAFAAMVGCRLPTAAEWRAALASQEGGAESQAGLANLRDAAWSAQWSYASALPAEIGAHLRPDRDVYAPGEAAQALERNDGVLYFEPVGRSAQRPFRHLVGNVAEFVRTGDGSIGIIGRSALSVPRDPGEVVALTRPVERSAYADVGFRLAFDAPGVRVRRPLRAEVLSLLGDRVVEVPASGGG